MHRSLPVSDHVQSRSKYILTEISEAQSMTMFVVARSVLDGTDQSNRAVFIGSYDTTLNPPGLGLHVQNTNRISAFGCSGIPMRPTLLSPPV